MATEKRLIYANDFHDYLEVIRQDYLEEDTLSSNFAAKVIETVQDEYLANAPTVDAVEVVRCKDCFHLKGRVCCNPSAGMWVGVELKDNDFCSYGERRNNGTKSEA